MPKKISCGNRKINKQFRIVLRDVCKMNEIKEGDIVKVTIEKVDDNDSL
jgi:Cu/Ag efflux protein CusF